MAIMSESETIRELQTQLAWMERHVTEQDAEMYRLSQRVDALAKKLEEYKAQLDALGARGASGAVEIPADEKPPHY